jgi:hypothetical protein
MVRNTIGSLVDGGKSVNKDIIVRNTIGSLFRKLQTG